MLCFREQILRGDELLTQSEEMEPKGKDMEEKGNWVLYGTCMYNYQILN